MNRPALVVALEALEVGNTNLAIAILFDLIDGTDERPPANRARCRQLPSEVSLAWAP